MPSLEGGVWVPDLAQKQFEVFNCYHKYVLVSGPRKSSKTIACLKRLIRHGWETPDARIAVITVTQKNAKIGVWDTLYRLVEEWVNAGIGLEISTPMKSDGATRMPYFRITNAFGGTSEFQLHSLDNENDIEAKMKGAEFTCVFVSELTNFRTDKVLRIVSMQLRSSTNPNAQFMWIADTNPDENEGKDFWAYKIWYEEPFEENHPFPSFQKQIKLIEFEIADNTYLSKDEVEEIHAMYSRDPDLYRVYVKGEWIETSTDSIFVGTFSPARHIVGADGDSDLVPEEEVRELYVGWDPGDVHNAVTFLEKVEWAGAIHWKALDEYVVIHGNISLEDFTHEVMNKMADWEETVGRPVRWIHWSDVSAIDRFRSVSGTYDQMVIFKASNGRIRLQGTPKFSGSVRLRVQIVKQLLQEDRLWVSTRCPALIASLRGGLKRGKSSDKFLKDNQHKHPFDSFSYPIMAETSWDLQVGEVPESIAASFSAGL